jgi:hypothetical protein
MLYYENDTLAEIDVRIGILVIKAIPTVINDNTTTTTALVAILYRTIYRCLIYTSEDIIRKVY